MDTVLRQIEILKIIPRRPRKIPISEIHRKIADSGYKVTRRTVERDLVALATILPLSSDDQKPQGWSWSGEPVLIPSLDPQTSLTFKLVELLRGRLDAPADARELLFGDDWESDSLIYSLYADVLAGRLAVDRLVPILRRIGVDARLVDQVVALAARVAGPDAVDRIFINLERRTPPATFRLFGPRVVPTFNYFQTAVVLGADGHLDVEDVAAVGRTLVERSGYTARGLENSLGDLVRRGIVSVAAADGVGEALRAAGLLPVGAPARSRWRRMRDAFRRLRRRRKARRTPAGPPTRAAVDYAAILDRLRPPGRESPIEGRPA